MDLFFAICEGLGLALAAVLAVVGAMALLGRPVGILASAATRMEGESSPRPLGLLVLAAAALVAAASLLLPPLALLAVLFAARLWWVRRRRAAGKHAGLRVLR
ncbi:MAG: hypothetical protein QOG09_759 [Solirubrobacterales bacterium]|nr:hypothetical protein [Solirubrobacterales bacterium]